MRRFKRAAESEPTHALPFSKQATRVDHTAQHPAVETVFKSNREISNAKAELSACTHDVVFQTRWSSSKGVMLFSISSGLAAQVEEDCWHESANVALTNFCARHAYVKPTSLSAPRLFGYVSLEVQAHLLELRTLSAHLLSRGCGSW